VWVSSSNCALVTSTSLSIVSWGLFGFLYHASGLAYSLCCVRFCHGFRLVCVKDGIDEVGRRVVSVFVVLQTENRRMLLFGKSTAIWRTMA